MFATAKENTAKNDMTNEGGRAADDFKEGLRRVKNDARDAANTVKGDIDGVMRQAGQQVRELADSAGHSVSDLLGSVKTNMREKPLQTGLIALGIGFVVGMIFRR